MTAALLPLSRPLDEYVPMCTVDPERWTTTEPDDEAKALCQMCPRRALCAREAYQDPNVEGLWAGVVIPESGRARDFALRRLRALAERGGYPVAPRRRGRPRGSRN
ncbi:WhiB family transcriptional regulator [Mycobacterium sp. 1423905.2]|uniref:WhiB family transcriptional regulator n=1 Tax=Mycobacterium sp. 1423905.2 TaxID=1856859 RepID=UPI0009F53EE7|nr:WhiB family transcriptional regulator [Mycobacterium sp. 1423905.2]